MIKNIKRIAGAKMGIPLMYCPQSDKDGDYAPGDRFYLGRATAMHHDMKRGVYMVTEPASKEPTFVIEGEKELGAALTGRAKMMAEFTKDIYIYLIGAGWDANEKTRAFAREEANYIIRDNES